MGVTDGSPTGARLHASNTSADELGSFSKPFVLDDDDNVPVVDQAVPPVRTRKRKVTENREGDHTNDEPVKKRRSPVKPRAKEATKDKKEKPEPAEKRLKRYRAHPPSSYLEVCNRALTQRFCILDRKRGGSPEQPSEVLEIAGTTGNVYTVTIDLVPSCDCPHAMKGNQCKHIVYVLKRTLKAPEELSYQLALTTSELREIFASAPPLPSEVAASEVDGGVADGKRKLLDDDCPICYDAFDDNEKSVWCKDGCGNNVHAGCFEKWAAQKMQSGGGVTCPFCRTQWREEDLRTGNLKGVGIINAEGYRNVALQLGLSGRRDYSSYHSYWVARQRREGLIDDDSGGFDS